MKKPVLLSLLFVLILCFCSCFSFGSSSNSSNTKSTSDTYVLVNGTKQPINYFNTINDIQIDDLQTSVITVKSKLIEVHGSTYFKALAYDVDSYLELDGNGSKNYVVETTGYEDTVKNWSPGDIIEATGTIYVFGDVNIFREWARAHGDGTISVKNVTKGESFTIVYTY